MRKKWWYEKPKKRKRIDQTFTEQFGEGMIYNYLSCFVWVIIAIILAALLVTFSTL